MKANKVEILSGATEQGIAVGNTFDKYNSSNFLINAIMRGFTKTLVNFVDISHPSSINEIGCGEGYWTLYWKSYFGTNFHSRGCDFSQITIDIAKKNAVESGFDSNIFKQKSIYDLEAEDEHADLIICTEVLEHLEDPALALEKLQEITQKNIILSVPNEPIWRISNLMRLKYVSELGNTPGHLQHWSKASFVKLVSKYFTVLDCKQPFPFTIVLAKKK